MNYIILSDVVIDSLKQQYQTFSNQYGYTQIMDVFMHEILSYDGSYRLLNHSMRETTYYLIGKKCILHLEKHKKYPNCFYGKKIKFYIDDIDFLDKLSQSIELPGEWEIIRFSEIYRINMYEMQSINEFLFEIKATKSEFYEFESKWKTWDIYNLKLKELQNKKEAESECEVKKVCVENNVFTLYLNSWSEIYIENEDVCVQLEGSDKFELLGKIVCSDKMNKQISVCCENYDFVRLYLERKTGSIVKIRYIDFGTIARLKRQRIAMQKLFQNETANKNLKEILVGEYDFSCNVTGNYTLHDAQSLFGTNMKQKEAYIGALNADNIYLIQGPPGTGKTTIITELINHIVSCNQSVLVSSETNIAVDNALERIRHTDKIIPVRLGHEERIGIKCVKYMPEHIVDSIIKSSEEHLTVLEEKGLDCDNLISECKEVWLKKITATEYEIYELKKCLPDECDMDNLYNQIESYENLIIEMNNMYDDLLSEQKEYNLLKNEEVEIQKEKNKIESYVNIIQTGVMKSGMEEADSEQMKQLPEYMYRLDIVNQKLINLKKQLSMNRYELLKGAYQRKNRRYNIEKKIFERINKSGNTLISTLHMIKNTISNIRYLQEQKQYYENCKLEEIEKIQNDFVHSRELWQKSESIRSEWMNSLSNRRVKNDIERIYINKVNVVFATCTGIASSNNGCFADREYDYVIIDEAAKCNMLDLLIPLVLGKKIILVGDHKQLYPMIETDGVSDELDKEQLKLLKEHILFKWLYEERVSNDNKIMLNRQYRMPYDVSHFVSSNFYNNELFCEKDKTEDRNMIWIDSEDAKEYKIGTTYENQVETEIIIQLLNKLDCEYDYGTEVGVICTYKAQAVRISNLLKNISFNNIVVECSTVDSFQGKERHTIIYNIVRSEKVTDYMKDENRVNVAVSRVKECLYVVGKLGLIQTRDSGCLRVLYEYIKKNGEVHNSRYVR